MTNKLYSVAGKHLLQLLDEVWATETSMQEWFKAQFHLDLDRTTRAKLLVTRLVDTALTQAGMPSGSILNTDRRLAVEAMGEDLGDINIFSQLMLNLQEGCPAFKYDKMLEDGKGIEGRYEPEASPLAKKAKFKTGTEETDKQYNADLSLLKNTKIVGEMSRGTNSYRVTPYSKTPALSDLNNLSSMSPSAIQPYLDGGELYMIEPQAALDFVHLRIEEGGITSPYLKHAIVSESGGDIVKKALASRLIASFLLVDPAIKHVVPRYESVLILRDGESVKLDMLIKLGLLKLFEQDKK